MEWWNRWVDWVSSTRRRRWSAETNGDWGFAVSLCMILSCLGRGGGLVGGTCGLMGCCITVHDIVMFTAGHGGW